MMLSSLINCLLFYVRKKNLTNSLNSYDSRLNLNKCYEFLNKPTVLLFILKLRFVAWKRFEWYEVNQPNEIWLTFKR